MNDYLGKIGPKLYSICKGDSPVPLWGFSPICIQDFPHLIQLQSYPYHLSTKYMETKCLIGVTHMGCILLAIRCLNFGGKMTKSSTSSRTAATRQQAVGLKATLVPKIQIHPTNTKQGRQQPAPQPIISRVGSGRGVQTDNLVGQCSDANAGKPLSALQPVRSTDRMIPLTNPDSLVGPCLPLSTFMSSALYSSQALQPCSPSPRHMRRHQILDKAKGEWTTEIRKSFWLDWNKGISLSTRHASQNKRWFRKTLRSRRCA